MLLAVAMRHCRALRMIRNRSSRRHNQRADLVALQHHGHRPPTRPAGPSGFATAAARISRLRAPGLPQRKARRW